MGFRFFGAREQSERQPSCVAGFSSPRSGVKNLFFYAFADNIFLNP